MAATTYTIDSAHSSAHFSVRHMMVTNVRGSFKGPSGTVVFDPENPAHSRIESVIDATTINTNDPQRDGHLKSADFLDVEKYPTITFRSKKVEKIDDETYKVAGDLTIHGITKEVVLDVEGPAPEAKDPWGNIKSGASATTKIKRGDFGLTWNAALETGGWVVGDEIKITLDLELVRQQTATA